MEHIGQPHTAAPRQMQPNTSSMEHIDQPRTAAPRRMQPNTSSMEHIYLPSTTHGTSSQQYKSSMEQPLALAASTACDTSFAPMFSEESSSTSTSSMKLPDHVSVLFLFYSSNLYLLSVTFNFQAGQRFHGTCRLARVSCTQWPTQAS